MVDTKCGNKAETKCMERNDEKKNKNTQKNSKQAELLQVLHYVILKWVEQFLLILQKPFQGSATQMISYQNIRLYYILACVITVATAKNACNRSQFSDSLYKLMHCISGQCTSLLGTFKCDRILGKLDTDSSQ